MKVYMVKIAWGFDGKMTKAFSTLEKAKEFVNQYRKLYECEYIIEEFEVE